MSYAKGTTVRVAKSRAEIEALLSRYGATSFAIGWDAASRAVLGFEAQGRRLRFVLPMPQQADKSMLFDGRGRRRTNAAVRECVEAESRRRWRALCLVIKAKLESVESGIETFETAFLANIVVPGTSVTVGEWARPQIARAYDTGAVMPPMLGSGS